MRRISMATRDELITVTAARYVAADRKQRGLILDEFTAISGFHRKHASRLLRQGPSKTRSGPRPSRRLYDGATRSALVLFWEASDRVCGKRLRVMLPLLMAAMERHGQIAMDAEVKTGILAMSAATIDRALRGVRGNGATGRRTASRPSAAVRRVVRVRTFSDWGDPAPGFFEADLVAHSGPAATGSFIQTLVMTDIATGWTEFAPLLFREQRLLTEVLGVMKAQIPMPILGLDTDNDSVFMNEMVLAWCATQSAEFTRSRPYKKNDQAWVEQKNGAVIRRLVGYRRYQGIEAAALLAELYASARLFVNVFPTVVQAGVEGPNGRAGYEAVSSAGNTLPASDGAFIDERADESPIDGAGDEPGSGRIAGAAARVAIEIVGPVRRRHTRVGQGTCRAGGVFGRTSNRVARRRNSTDSDGAGQAGTPLAVPDRSVRSGCRRS